MKNTREIFVSSENSFWIYRLKWHFENMRGFEIIKTKYKIFCLTCISLTISCRSSSVNSFLYFVIKGDVIEEYLEYSVKFIYDDHKCFPAKFVVIPKICINDCPFILQYSSIFLFIFITLTYTESSSFFYLNIQHYLLKGIRSKELPLARLQFIVGELPCLFYVIHQKHRRDSS